MFFAGLQAEKTDFTVHTGFRTFKKARKLPNLEFAGLFQMIRRDSGFYFWISSGVISS